MFVLTRHSAVPLDILKLCGNPEYVGRSPLYDKSFVCDAILKFNVCLLEVARRDLY